MEYNRVVITDDELVRILKKVVLAYSKTLSRHLPVQTEENHEKSQDNR
jgi:hypothetical protein